MLKRTFVALALIAVPTAAMSQTQTAATRGCPAPPTGEVAGTADSVPPLVGETREIQFVAPHDGWEMGRISWVAADSSGLIYIFQRGEKAEPIVVVNSEGRVVRSWGKGLFNVPHSLRIDPQGNVWATDANTSVVRKFSPAGNLLLTIEVGDVPGACDWPTRGTTDLAFAPDGRVYVADGYTNARIVAYTAKGEKVREWGSRGTGPGQFVLPHSIAIDDKGTVFVADRENGRIQRFDLEGKYLGEVFVGGKPFTLVTSPAAILADVRTLDASNRPRPTLVRVSGDAMTGRMIAPGGHGIAALRGGAELLVPAGPKLFRVSLTH